MYIENAITAVKNQEEKITTRQEYINLVLMRCSGRTMPTVNKTLEFIRAATLTALVCSRRTAAGSSIVIVISKLYRKRGAIGETIRILRRRKIPWQLFFLFVSWYYDRAKMLYSCLPGFIIYEAYKRLDYALTHDREILKKIKEENRFASKIVRLVKYEPAVEKIDDGLDLLRSL